MSRPEPASAGVVGPPETDWDWLQRQLAGRPVPPVLTIIGLGDGGLLEALDVHAPATKVLAVEPDPSRAVLARPVADAWRRAGRLVYLVGPQFAGAEQGWRIFPSRFEEPPLLVHPRSAVSPGLRAALAVLRKIVFGAKANAEARRLFAPRYLTNSLRNLPDMMWGRDVRELSGIAPGRPAVVVGAGPSLDDSLADLKRLGPRAVVIATDTSLRPLLSHGVVPQFVVALDPSEINGRHLLDLPPSGGTWLVAESALEPRAASRFRGRTFWFRVAPHQPWPWLNDLGFDVGQLEVWGSVLTAAFQVACLAGCDPISMVGSDLSFPGGRPYARGTTYEFDWAWEAAYGTDVETTWQAQLARRTDVRIERDVTGAEVPTTGVMLQFRDWIVAQAGKNQRRLINATGRGLLMGQDVKQAQLSDVLAGAAPLPTLFDTAARPRHPRAAAIAEAMRAVSAGLAAGTIDAAPIVAWREFSGEGFCLERVSRAVEDARLGLEAARGEVPRAAAATSSGATLCRLPEALSALRSRLGGEPSAVRSESPGPERAAVLVTALEELADLVRHVVKGPEFQALPDPALIGTVPAGALALWPETVRWAALRLEARLADAWAQAVPPLPRVDPGTSPVVPLDAAIEGERAPDETPLKARHACLLLALEWLAAVSSLSEGNTVREAIERLAAVEALLRRALLTPQPGGPASELVLQASAGGRVSEVRLPLGLSELALARVMAGTIRARGDHVWELGAATVAGLSVRVAVRVPDDASVPPPRMRAAAVTARPVTAESGRPLKVAGEAPAGVLAVVDFSTETRLVRADGSVTPYQSWPRPITGALSLGHRGDVAWSNVWQPQHERTPFLLYRPEPGADVVAFELPFRPARGIWWRDRLYVTFLPTRDLRGGVAVWAPGEQPAIVLRDLPLQGIVPVGDELCLEPFVPGTPRVVARQRATRGWRWTPGAPPELRTLGPLGAASETAAASEWTATAYPQADVVTLAHRDGTQLELRCYNPLRLGWAEGSLVVSGAGGETMLFERLLDTIEVR